MEFYHLISVLLLFIINSTDKTLAVNKLCENNGKIRPNFAEIFGLKWENGNTENQNENYNQNEQNNLNANANYQNANQLDEQQKREIVHKFDAIKEGIKKRRKYSKKVWNKIDQKICKKLGIYRNKIYKWKKEFGLSQEKKRNQKNYYERKKQEFIERIDEFKKMLKNGKQHKFVKELNIGEKIFRKWKKEFGIEIGKTANRYTMKEKTRKMNIYYAIKRRNSKISDRKIAKFLQIGENTLIKWKQ